MNRVTEQQKVDFLSNPGNYPQNTKHVDVIETHMSWVFLTERFVYKMKKSIRLPFLDFSTLAARKKLVETSLRLNRRLAPAVYLDAVPLVTEQNGCLRLGGIGEPVEWLEKMRRLPEDKMLHIALKNHTTSNHDARRIAAALSEFYTNAEPVKNSSTEFLSRLTNHLDENISALKAYPRYIDPDQLTICEGHLKQFILDSVPIFSSRISAGKIIEAHGDLRPEHICLLHPPVFIDCLEFNREFRVLDVIDELSYLALECEFLGEPQFGDEILNTYSQQTHDYVTPSLINFYKSHRALLRSKLAAWHTRDHPPAQHAKWLLRAADYFTLAIRFARLIEAARSTTGKLVQ